MQTFSAPLPSAPVSTAGRRRRGRSLVAALLTAALVAACNGGAGDTGDTGDTEDDPAGAPAEAEPDATAADGDDLQLAVAVASFDLAVGESQRLLAGLYTQERQLLGFGEVTFDLGHLGDAAGGETELTQRATAAFLPVPGAEPEGDAAQPTVMSAQDGTGVYAAEVDLDQPGYWGLRVTAQLADGSVHEGQATFEVHEEPGVPAVGDEAPAIENLTLADVEAGTAEPESLDSRAIEDGEVPSPQLHRTTIAEAVEQGRPVVAIFSTPVYCVSRFCGPLVETIEDLADRYAERADFVMVEVWEDFDEQRLNAAAAEWIQTETGGNEPWTFLVGEDGRIAARWDNVLDVAELEAELDALPAIPPRAEGTPADDLVED
ncbi:hypothetical protein [Egicoccus halophilus]|uniref:Thioredoxin domain-containing protein n=1 Tax=Egicoccus halophilus TaxID=1670830 RepID=A0A8J3A6G6_9ACTN|nr:hypothetical protein [Egicoccus halophilus]GGI04285.1 hypothetical protein GCM10011354_08330 [Egicoccus halophilus]